MTAEAPPPYEQLHEQNEQNEQNEQQQELPRQVLAIIQQQPQQQQQQSRQAQELRQQPSDAAAILQPPETRLVAPQTISLAPSVQCVNQPFVGQPMFIATPGQYTAASHPLQQLNQPIFVATQGQQVDVSAVPSIGRQKTEYTDTKKARRLNIATAILGAVFAIVLLAGISTQSWVKYARDSYSSSYQKDVTIQGLWMTCTYDWKENYTTGRGEWHVDCEYYTSGQGVLSVLYTAVYVAAVIINFVVVRCKTHSKRNLVLVILVLYSVAAGLIVIHEFAIAEGVYSLYVSPVARNLSWSFALVFFANIGAVIQVVLIGVSLNQYQRVYGNVHDNPGPGLRAGINTPAISPSPPMFYRPNVPGWNGI